MRWFRILPALLIAFALAGGGRAAKAQSSDSLYFNTGVGPPYTQEDRRGFLDLLVAEMLNANSGLDDGDTLRVAGLEPPLHRMEMFFYVHRKHRGLLERAANALPAMKADGTYDGITGRALRHLLPAREDRP